jgi:hypothetical protein
VSGFRRHTAEWQLTLPLTECSQQAHCQWPALAFCSGSGSSSNASVIINLKVLPVALAELVLR